MSRQNNRTERDRKPEGQRRDAAGNALRYSLNSRESRFGTDRERDLKTIQLNRNYLNDLYERSSI